MPDILAFGLSAMATSASGIPTPNDQLNQAGTIQSTFASVQYVTQLPTFGGITSLTPQSNGALRAGWSAATTPLTPVTYDVYIQAATATGLFVDANKVRTTFGLTLDLFALTDGTLLALGTTYFMGIRARDPYGNVSTSTASLSAASLGVQPSRVLAPGDIPSIVAAVWDEIQAGHTTAGSFGKYLDAQASATKTVVDTINTKVGTPVGASLSADIAAVKAVEDTINTKIGTPVASVSTDIAAVKTVEDTINTKIGTPATASVSGDIAAVKAVDDAINTKVGIPVSSVSADIAAVKTDIATSKTVIDTINTKVGNPVGSSLSADIAQVQSGVNTTNTKIGTPTGANVSADIAAVKADEVTLLGRLTPTRAANLDHLDVDVSSRESETDAAIRAAATATASSTVLTAVQSIQNNTTFVGIVPPALIFPPSGTLDYKFFANLFSTSGSPKDPDGSVMYYRIDTTAGVSHVATTAMTRTGVGEFETTHTVAYNDAELELVVTFTYVDESVSFVQRRLTSQTQSSNQLETLLARLTPTRAANLDYLDVSVASRVSDANDLTRYNNLLTQHATSQTKVDALSTKIGTPVLGSTTADITAVRVQTDKIGSPAHGTLASDTAAIEAKIGTPVATLASDIAAVKSVDDTINTKIGTPVASVSADIATVKGLEDTINTKIGTPVASVSTDIAAVKAVDDSISSRIGTPTGASVSADIVAVKAVEDTINTKIGSPVATLATDIAAIKAVDDTINTKIGTPDVTVSADIASVKSDSNSLRIDYTTLRAAKLDNLDATVSSRQTEVAAAIRFATLDANEQVIIAGIDGIQANSTLYTNRMTTTFNTVTGQQEILCWATKYGALAIGGLCSITVKDSIGATIWSDSLPGPSLDGIYRFLAPVDLPADGNYYVIISAFVDGDTRTNLQSFFSVA